MKDILLSLGKRNGLVISFYAVAMTVLSFVPEFGMAAVWVILFLMLGLIWANGILVKHTSRLLAALVTAVLTLVIGGAVVVMTKQIQGFFAR